MSLNPRKFSEKIALQQQKQAEGTAAYEQIIKEVGAAIKLAAVRPSQRSQDDRKEIRRSHSPQTSANVKEELNILRRSLDSRNTPTTLQSSFLHCPSNSSTSSLHSSPHITRKPTHFISPLTTNNLSSSNINNNNYSSSYNNINHLVNNNSVKPHKRKKYSCDRHKDYSPYSTNHLSTPPDNSWRRACSDSSIHANLLNNNDTPHASNEEDAALDLQRYMQKAYATSMNSRPKSCEGSGSYRNPVLRRLIFDERMKQPQRTTSNYNLLNNNNHNYYDDVLNNNNNSTSVQRGEGQGGNGGYINVFGSLPDFAKSHHIAVADLKYYNNNDINNNNDSRSNNNKHNNDSDHSFNVNYGSDHSSNNNYNDGSNLLQSCNNYHNNYNTVSPYAENDGMDESVDVNGYVDGVDDNDVVVADNGANDAVAAWNAAGQQLQPTSTSPNFGLGYSDNNEPHYPQFLHGQQQQLQQQLASQLNNYDATNNNNKFSYHHQQQQLRPSLHHPPSSPSITLTEIDNLNQPINTVLLESPSFSQLEISPSWDKFLQSPLRKSFPATPLPDTTDQSLNTARFTLFSLLHNSNNNIPVVDNSTIKTITPGKLPTHHFQLLRHLAQQHKPTDSVAFNEAFMQQLQQQLMQQHQLTDYQHTPPLIMQHKTTGLPTTTSTSPVAPADLPKLERNKSLINLLSQQVYHTTITTKPTTNFKSTTKNKLSTTTHNASSYSSMLNNNIDPSLIDATSNFPTTTTTTISNFPTTTTSYFPTTTTTSYFPTTTTRDFPSLTCLGDSFDEQLLIDDVTVDDLFKLDPINPEDFQHLCHPSLNH